MSKSLLKVFERKLTALGRKAATIKYQSVISSNWITISESAESCLQRVSSGQIVSVVSLDKNSTHPVFKVRTDRDHTLEIII